MVIYLKKNWFVKRDCRGMTVGEIIDAIFKDRGIEENDIRGFLNPTDDDLIPFDKMENIDEAASVLLKAIDVNLKFCVHYDVDLDGCSAGSIATKWLEKHDITPLTIINNKKIHGVSNLNVDLLKDIDVLWIVDSIETSIEPYEKLLENGIKHIIITDHHLISKALRNDMKLTGKITLISSAVDYDNPELSGSGVTWKLCQYVDYLELDNYSNDLVDLAACGIIGDMTSVGKDSYENRYICKKGFENQKNIAIKKINGSFPFDSQAVSFGIAPLVNAANRTNENEKAMELFINNNDSDVKNIVSELKKCKEKQNSEVSYLMDDIKLQAESQMENKVMYFFISPENDVKGLIGNKLIELYQRPVMVLEEKIKVDDETGEVEKIEYNGSARGIGVDNFKKLVDDTGLAGTGGHENAFGVWFDSENFEEIKLQLELALENVEFEQNEIIDIQITQDQITKNLINQIKLVDQISGKNWPPVKILISDVNDYEIGTMSGGKHLKLIADCGKLLYIKWNYRYDRFPGGNVNVVGSLNSGFFGRTFYKQFIIDDWKIN